MIVALDSTPLATPFGGIRRYVEELHRALTREFPDDRFLLLSDQNRSLRGLERKWWLHGLPQALQRNEANLFHGTDFAVPYRKTVPAVLTIHDLSPWRFPEETSPRVRRRTPWLLRLGLADAVITPSEAIRREAITRFRLSPERTHAIPLGVSEVFHPGSRELPAKRTQPYFLAVGMGAGRKNLATIQAAHALLPKRGEHHPLFITSNLPEKRGVKHPLTPVSDAGLPELYANAVALLYPSLYEGFGLPILEAMACGTPVIASTDPALVETAGGAALHLDPLDVRAWTEAMQAVLENPERTQSLRAAGLKRAAQFRWASTAQKTREVYADVLQRSR